MAKKSTKKATKKSTKKPAAKKAAAKKTKPAKKRAKKVASTETVKAAAPAPVANTSSADTSDENAEFDSNDDDSGDIF